MRKYTDIIIEGDRFFIIETADKPKGDGVALNTLACIERVMRQKLQYIDDGVSDEYAKLSQEALWGKLMQIAESIQNNFNQKTSQISSIKKAFGGVLRQEKGVAAAYNRIVLLSVPPSVLKLPNDTIQNILPNELSYKELKNMVTRVLFM